MNLRKVYIGAALIGAFIIYESCSHHEKSRVQEIKEYKEPVTYQMSSEELQMEEGLRTVLTEIGELDSQFLIAKRAHQITNLPCSNCHTKNVKDLKSKGTKKAHWDIELLHADNGVMECASCHNMDRPDALTSLRGSEVSFDHSYKLCAQCHSTQYKDWQGGAHGKSLVGWVPPRISQTCTGCHSPHKPAFEQRWPSRLNTVRLEQKKK